jgi:hypothetical protein
MLKELNDGSIGSDKLKDIMKVKLLSGVENCC